MKERILTAMFTVAFALTGCGIDSAFEDGAGSMSFWLFCAATTIVCGYILLCKKGD